MESAMITAVGHCRKAWHLGTSFAESFWKIIAQPQSSDSNPERNLPSPNDAEFC
jgi:hypothetical protein